MAWISDEAAVNHIHTCVRITDDMEYEHSSLHDNWLYLVILQMSGKKFPTHCMLMDPHTV